ncbi:MAG: FkbM family methyltransferase [Acidobacteria bacterium]|nr:MAG: FkbM family methyltransferase [Acidobacteriota bacterium]
MSTSRIGRLGRQSYRVFKKASNWLDRTPLSEPETVPSAQAILINSWFAIEGDKTLRLEYDLDEDSIVFDVGGYKGLWATDIAAMYGCRIHVFEPIPEFARSIAKRFAKNSRISVHPFGLSDRNQTVGMSVDRDSSSSFKSGAMETEAEFVCMTSFLQEHNISRIDLIKINIEGGEYDLLDHILETGFVSQITNIQVQFHDFVPGAEIRMKRIQTALEKTHRLTYHYPFIWENWQRRESGPKEI